MNCARTQHKHNLAPKYKHTHAHSHTYMQTLCVFWTNHQHMAKQAGQEKQQAVEKKMRKIEEKKKPNRQIPCYCV